MPHGSTRVCHVSADVNDDRSTISVDLVNIDRSTINEASPVSRWVPQVSGPLGAGPFHISEAGGEVACGALASRACSSWQPGKWRRTPASDLKAGHNGKVVREMRGGEKPHEEEANTAVASHWRPSFFFPLFSCSSPLLLLLLLPLFFPSFFLLSSAPLSHWRQWREEP